MYLKPQAQVNAVLATCTQQASSMTHALRMLGDGDMGTGVLTLWDCARAKGFAQGAASVTLTLGATYCIYNIIKNHVENRRMRQNLQRMNDSERSLAIEGGF